MNRDEHEIGKNAEEANDLALFLAAYRAVTGERLSDEERGPDPPDFICARRDGSLVGVELTKIMLDDGGSPYARLRTPRTTWTRATPSLGCTSRVEEGRADQAHGAGVAAEDHPRPSAHGGPR